MLRNPAVASAWAGLPGGVTSGRVGA